MVAGEGIGLWRRGVRAVCVWEMMEKRGGRGIVWETRVAGSREYFWGGGVWGGLGGGGRG